MRVITMLQKIIGGIIALSLIFLVSIIAMKIGTIAIETTRSAMIGIIAAFMVMVIIFWSLNKTMSRS